MGFSSLTLFLLALTAGFSLMAWTRFKKKRELAQQEKTTKVETKTKYLCSKCPQHFEPPFLPYQCPVCQGRVDKFENGVLVAEHNPAFKVEEVGALPFVRREDVDAPPKPPLPAKRETYRDNVVALNLKAVDTLHMTCWLVVRAESANLAQTIADQARNFRVLYKRKPVSLGKDRWLVWGKARSAA